MSDVIDAVYLVKEHLPRKYYGMFCAGCAELLIPLYLQYDLEGSRFQLLRTQLDRVWLALQGRLKMTEGLMNHTTLANRTVPEIDSNNSRHSTIAEAVAMSVVNVCHFLQDDDVECPRYACEQIESIVNIFSESKDSEAAYSRALIAMRGLPPEELAKQLKILNKIRPTTNPEKRATKIIRAFCAAVKKATLSDPTPDQLTAFAGKVHSLAPELVEASKSYSRHK